MMRPQVYFNKSTGRITVTPQWPPSPQPKDCWEKTGGTRVKPKKFSRKVVSVERRQVTYEAQDGAIKTCSVDAFVKWCDMGGKAKRLADWHLDYDEDTEKLVLRPKSHTRLYKQERKKASKKKKVRERA